MNKTICICDGCGKELAKSQDHYHIDFTTSRFCDAAGDMDYNFIRADLCEGCCHDVVKALNRVAFVAERRKSDVV